MAEDEKGERQILSWFKQSLCISLCLWRPFRRVEILLTRTPHGDTKAPKMFVSLFVFFKRILGGIRTCHMNWFMLGCYPLIGKGVCLR